MQINIIIKINVWKAQKGKTEVKKNTRKEEIETENEKQERKARWMDNKCEKIE